MRGWDGLGPFARHLQEEVKIRNDDSSVGNLDESLFLPFDNFLGQMASAASYHVGQVYSGYNELFLSDR